MEYMATEKLSEEGRTDGKGGWRAATFIYFMIFADALMVVGIGVNVVTYAYGNLHLSLAKSATTATTFTGLAYILPLFWGFLADAYVGRLWITIFSYSVSFVGLLLLTLSVSVSSLKPPSCTPTALNPLCPEASHEKQNWFFSAIYLLAVGSGGLKPTLLSMGQDQFEEHDPLQNSKGSLFFSGYYAILNLASLLGSTVAVYIQSNVGYDWGYGIILGIYFLSIIIYSAAMPFYRQMKPTGSILTRLAKVVVAAVRNIRKPLPADADDLYEVTDDKASMAGIRKVLHTNRFRFLDKAAIQPEATQHVSEWQLCTVSQVEELKALMQIIPVWMCSTCVWAMYAQVTSVCVEQASTMDRKFGRHFTMPAASSISILVISGLIFLPIYEELLVPRISRITGHPRGLSPLRRMGAAFFLATVAMIIGAQVEQRRVNVIRDHDISDLEAMTGGVPMSVFWLLPQLAILGVAEILLGVAQIHFFYEETPDNMRSMAISLFFVAISVGYFVSTALINTVNRATRHSGGWLAADFNRGGMKKYYYLLATIVASSFVVFLCCAQWYRYKKVQPLETNRSKVLPGPSPSPHRKQEELELQKQGMIMAE